MRRWERKSVPPSPAARLWSSPWVTRADHLVYEQPLRNEVCQRSWWTTPAAICLSYWLSALLCLPCPMVSFCPCLRVEASNILEILQRSLWMCQSGPACSVKVTAGQLHCRPQWGLRPLGFRVAVRGSLTGSDCCWPSRLSGTQVLLFTENWIWEELQAKTWAHSDSQGHTCLHVRHLWPR